MLAELLEYFQPAWLLVLTFAVLVGTSENREE